MRPPIVLHVDMDCFFVQVERQKDPALNGKPVVVGGHSVRRGVVSSASYEARAFGIGSAMPLYQAHERCPTAIFLPVDMDAYREASRRLVEIWREFAPLVEVAGLDEAYLDLSGCEAVLGSPLAMAERLQQRVLAASGYPCSVGAGTSKLIAKTASKKHKPAGIFAVKPGSEAAWLAPMGIRELHGVGPATAGKLEQMGVTTIGQLRTVDLALLRHYVGPAAGELVEMAEGRDPHPVSAARAARSISSEETFETDITQRDTLRRVIQTQSEQIAYRLRKEGSYAKTVTLKLRYANFETLTRSKTLPQATDQDDAFTKTAWELLDRHLTPGRPVRLIGVTLSHLTETAQLSLIDQADDHKKKQLYQTMDAIKDRFGRGAIQRGLGF